ncbi:MAG: cysteine hydrolase [Calditrichaeota bacterium]|nr:cysteine hydrolase [Calditrichota bacterium]
MKIIFWDVDTQYDFMMSDGKLYVPGAEEIIPNLEKLTRYARDKGIPILGSVDYHNPDDPEISDQPDFKETFPPHCLKGEPGQEKIDATRPQNPLWIDSDPLDPDRLKQMIEAHQGEIIFRKQRFDVFTNPNVEPVLNIVRPDVIVVYGVALDVCDMYAMEGFLRIGKYRLYLVEDATRPIYPERGQELIKNWKERGVHIVQTRDVVEKEILFQSPETVA